MFPPGAEGAQDVGAAIDAAVHNRSVPDVGAAVADLIAVDGCGDAGKELATGSHRAGLAAAFYLHITIAAHRGRKRDDHVAADGRFLLGIQGEINSGDAGAPVEAIRELEINDRALLDVGVEAPAGAPDLGLDTEVDVPEGCDDQAYPLAALLEVETSMRLEHEAARVILALHVGARTRAGFAIDVDVDSISLKVSRACFG